MRGATSRDSLISLLLVVGLLLVAAAGYFFLITPKNDDAKAFNVERDSLQQQRVDLEAQLARIENAEADLPQLYQLAKAAPDHVDVPGVVLELTNLASKAGATVRSIQVGDAQEGEGYSGQPFTVVIGGNFDTVADFMKQVRTLVFVRSNKLRARGNLYQLGEFSLGEGAEGFPSIDATIDLIATGAVGTGETGSAASPGDGSDPNGDQPEGDSETEGNGG